MSSLVSESSIGNLRCDMRYCCREGKRMDDIEVFYDGGRWFARIYGIIYHEILKMNLLLIRNFDDSGTKKITSRFNRRHIYWQKDVKDSSGKFDIISIDSVKCRIHIIEDYDRRDFFWVNEDLEL